MRQAAAALACILCLACGAAQGEETLELARTGFADMPGWSEDEPVQALEAFAKSCGRIRKLRDDFAIGKGRLAAPAVQWKRLCYSRPPKGSNEAARLFFESAFVPYRVLNAQGGEGLLTGYYEPLLHGSRQPTAKYDTPLYRPPHDLREGVPYLTRGDVMDGKLAGQGLELLWVDDPVDAFFLQVQGSGRVRLPDGETVAIRYAGTNNQPYVAIGSLLAKQGVIPKEKLSLFTIRQWLRDHPREGAAIMRQNTRYVFFKEQKGDGPLGASGAALTPERSLAVDDRYIPYGMPVYVDTFLPATPRHAERPYQRLFIAQDTGKAIKGAVRGDIFFGFGEEAESHAGRMKAPGRFTLLVPHFLADAL